MSTPMVPPRPTRANGTTSTATESTPPVPARPIRKTDPSPSRDFRSPLNELPDPMGRMSKRLSQSNLATSELPPRPPSVSFPSVGQEGSEYAGVSLLTPEAAGARSSAAPGFATPEQTINVARDMPLHAPKASVPQSTAKSRIETVTATDSTQAAAAGIGKAKPADDVHKTPLDSSSLAPDSQGSELKRVVTEPASLRQKPSFSRPGSGAAMGSRPSSIFDDEHQHGIPEIGQQIPLYPNAGDVQAPSPGPTQSQHTPGVGFFNDGSARSHQRRKSARPDWAPPGSYGLHSHSIEPHDQFERDWYAKNPDRALAEGHNVYRQPRPETALSSAELNRIVTQTDDAGMGTDPTMISTPGEEIGYSASEFYAARMSPKSTPAPTRERSKRPSSGSQPAVESPLRRTSYSWRDTDQAVAPDDDGSVHVDPPEYRWNKVTGGGPADNTVDLGPRAGNTAEEGGWYMERGPGTPILASDEVLKRHESSYMQPAVNPEYHYDEYESDHAYDSRRSSLRVPSRPSSRHGTDYHGGNLHRFMSHEEPHHGSGMHSPLEEIEEYEPLIPEGEDDVPLRKAKAQEAAKKRPGLEHHHFPSQDIWEDTPSSMMFSTTVDTPDVSSDEKTMPSSKGPSALFETPDQEEKRKVQNPDDMMSDEKTLLKPHYASRVVGDRPGIQRFPSKDIWEDSPSSLQYQTTVGSPQMDDSRSPPDERPTTTAIPGSQDDSGARATTTGIGQLVRPSIPARPKQRSKLAEEIKPLDVSDQQQDTSREISEDQATSPEKTKAPAIPERPKPTVPARPARTSRSDQSEPSGTQLTKSTSLEDENTTAPPLPLKTKPAVPARPVGEKLAALKAGFMNDLNNRLKIGPQPAKTKDIEPEVAEESEKAPLADARKSRAKGPARRKPAAPASDVAADGFSMSNTLTMWSIDETEELQVPALSKDVPSSPELEKAMSANAAKNTGEVVPPEPISSPVKTFSPPPSEEIARRTSSPEERKSLQTKLEEALADVGAAPAPETVETTESTGKGADAIAQADDETEGMSTEKAIEEESVAHEHTAES